MNGSFVLGFFFIVVGIPVILGIGGDMYKRHLKFKEKQLTLLSNETAEKAAQYAAHTERLEALIPEPPQGGPRSEEHTSELQSLMRISYAVFCFQKTKKTKIRSRRYSQITSVLPNTTGSVILINTSTVR